MITLVSAPTNLGLRPPRPGSVPGTAKAPEALHEAGLHAQMIARGATDGGVVLPGRYVDDDATRPAGLVRNQDALIDHARRLARRLADVRAAGRAPLVLGALGETVIPQRPQRVVSLGATDADVALALGVTPVGIRNHYGYPRGVGPWAEDELGSAEPTLWTRELDVEAVAALEPDLILDVQDDGDPQVHAQLSRIAPTVSLPVDAQSYGASWQDVTRLVAQALGRAADGDALVARTEAELAAVAAAHPEFAGRTASYLDLFAADVYVGGPDSAAVALLAELGLRPPDYVTDLPDAKTQNQVSLELLPQVDADAVVAYTFGRSREQVLAEVPTLAELPAVRDGALIVLTDTALSQPSVLSIPYVLDQLEPQLAVAVAS